MSIDIEDLCGWFRARIREISESFDDQYKVEMVFEEGNYLIRWFTESDVLRGSVAIGPGFRMIETPFGDLEIATLDVPQGDGSIRSFLVRTSDRHYLIQLRNFVSFAQINVIRNEQEEGCEKKFLHDVRVEGPSVDALYSDRNARIGGWLIVKREWETRTRLSYAFPATTMITSDEWYYYFERNTRVNPPVHFRDFPRFPPNIPSFRGFEPIDFQDPVNIIEPPPEEHRPSRPRRQFEHPNDNLF